MHYLYVSVHDARVCKMIMMHVCASASRAVFESRVTRSRLENFAENYVHVQLYHYSDFLCQESPDPDLNILLRTTFMYSCIILLIFYVQMYLYSDDHDYVYVQMYYYSDFLCTNVSLF